MVRSGTSVVSAWVLTLLMLIASLTAAAADEWVLIGSREIDLTRDRVAIDAANSTGRFKAIQIQVQKRGLTLTRAVITLAGGARQSQDLGESLLAGGKSKPITLGNEERFLEGIELSWRATPDATGANRAAVIEVFGLQSPEGARARRPGQRPVFSSEAPAPSIDGTRGARPSPSDTTRSQPAPATRTVGSAQPPPPIAAAPVPSTAPAAVPPATGRSAAADAKPYATVPVLFGTDRKPGEIRKAKWGDSVATFGADSQFKLALGQALVTVPTKDRERGSVPRPELVMFGFRVKWGEEQLDKHFTVYSAGVLTQDAFLAEVQKTLDKSKSKDFGKHALLFIHGYNVTFEDSLYRTAQIAYDLEFDGASFMYSWPSRGDPTAYLADHDRALGARPYLREMLELISTKTKVENLHVVAHSKGAELLVEVLNAMSELPDVRRKLRINEVILAAPDIDRANFEQIAQRIVGVAQRGVTLYASNNDKALGLSAKFRLGKVRAGEVPKDQGPVLIKGIDTIDISAASTDFFGSNHITFVERQSLIKDIGAILRTGTHPPDQRSSVLFAPVSTARGLYWKFVK